MIHASNAYTEALKIQQKEASKVSIPSVLCQKLDQVLCDNIETFSDSTCMFVSCSDLNYLYKVDVEYFSGYVRSYFESLGYHYEYSDFKDSTTNSSHSVTYRTWGILVSLYPIQDNNRVSRSTNTPENSRT